MSKQYRYAITWQGSDSDIVRVPRHITNYQGERTFTTLTEAKAILAAQLLRYKYNYAKAIKRIRSLKAEGVMDVED